jgi:hypothetical protein
VAAARALRVRCVDGDAPPGPRGPRAAVQLVHRGLGCGLASARGCWGTLGPLGPLEPSPEPLQASIDRMPEIKTRKGVAGAGRTRTEALGASIYYRFYYYCFYYASNAQVVITVVRKHPRRAASKHLLAWFWPSCHLSVSSSHHTRASLASASFLTDQAKRQRTASRASLLVL